MLLRKTIYCLPALMLSLFAGLSQAQILPDYQPDRAAIAERYRNMAHLDTAIRNTVLKTGVQANWQEGNNSFWYRNILHDSISEYIFVDAVKGTRQKAFDHSKMAAALSTATGKTYSADRLRIGKMKFGKDAQTVVLQLADKTWEVNLQDYAVKTASPFPPDNAGFPPFRGRGRRERFVKESPDKQWNVFTSKGNLFVQKVGGTDSVQLTTNGTIEKPYGSATWSPDSKYVVAYLTTPYNDSSVSYIATSLPGTMRGQIRSQQYKQPGDSFPVYEMYVFDVAKKTNTKISDGLIDFFGPPELHWRKGNAGYFLFEKRDRGHQRFRIIEVNAATAATRNIVDEQTKTFIYEQRIFTEYLPETNEIIWVSEKDGWRHIYLVNSLAGTITREITKGNWVVRDVDSIDSKKREIWFKASGMVANEDPYNVHYYRIGFDGKNLVSLTPETGNHTISFSAGKAFFTDTWSQINVAPVTVLRKTQDGKKLTDLEQADISAYLATGIRLPEPFVSKGRDGVTDIWGVIFRPSKFDSTKKYPVIEYIYAGPQDAFVPKNFLVYGEMQSMAELGFIVVQMDGMGTANRSKAFHDICWKNLADAGFADRILWIQSLAKKYAYVDAGKVGIYGTSAGGQNSLGALLFHPEFYKAAVSACGCHDNRVDKQWWNEQWMGYPVGKHYEEQSNVTNAWKLQGDLLLIVGEADTNVPPESTYRVADALIKANKSFDFLAVPGMGHSDGGLYGRAKKRDFFVKSLLGVDPPGRNATGR